MSVSSDFFDRIAKRILTAHAALLPDLVTTPDAIHLWRAGIWMVSLEVAHPQQSVWRTNAVPIALAPVITLDPAAVKPNHVAVGAQVNLSCTPRLSPQQGNFMQTRNHGQLAGGRSAPAARPRSAAEMAIIADETVDLWPPMLL